MTQAVENNAAEEKPGGNRRQARRYAVQAIYQYLIADTEIGELVKQFASQSGYQRSDRAYFQKLVRGVLDQRSSLEEGLSTHLDRPIGQLDSVEHAALLVAAFELRDCLETPYRVVIHENVELAKLFGGEDGHRYVNAVLDKLAVSLREAERNSA